MVCLFGSGTIFCLTFQKQDALKTTKVFSISHGFCLPLGWSGEVPQDQKAETPTESNYVVPSGPVGRQRSGLLCRSHSTCSFWRQCTRFFLGNNLTCAGDSSFFALSIYQSSISLFQRNILFVLALIESFSWTISITSCRSLPNLRGVSGQGSTVPHWGMDGTTIPRGPSSTTMPGAGWLIATSTMRELSECNPLLGVVIS